ncbi:MAG: hypothetical protein WD577_10325 [Bacteroidales bacterium]
MEDININTSRGGTGGSRTGAGRSLLSDQAIRQGRGIHPAS